MNRFKVQNPSWSVFTFSTQVTIVLYCLLSLTGCGQQTVKYERVAPYVPESLYEPCVPPAFPEGALDQLILEKHILDLYGTVSGCNDDKHQIKKLIEGK
uniref:Rz-like spanin n=1 Tax=Klebsiella phage vB_Kpn1-P3 TaxID=3230838 RepID=A0AAU8EEN7_9VIRU